MGDLNPMLHAIHLADLTRTLRRRGVALRTDSLPAERASLIITINAQEQFAEFLRRLAHLDLAVPDERLQPLFVEYVELRRLVGVLEQEVVAANPRTHSR